MAVFNRIVAISFVLGLASYYYHHRAERQSVVGTAALNDMANARASLPKWDDRLYRQPGQ
jgi:hypothetical protein